MIEPSDHGLTLLNASRMGDRVEDKAWALLSVKVLLVVCASASIIAFLGASTTVAVDDAGVELGPFLRGRRTSRKFSLKSSGISGRVMF